MRIFYFILSFIPAAVSAQEHYLVINPEGHRSNIQEMKIDADGNIATASFDKSVKIWDAKRGNLIKEFRGQIGPGSEGMVYALDISPDNKYLACGGWFGKDDESENLGDVRIYDYKTGKQIHLLKSVHQNVIKTCKFTKDSKYIITGDDDGIIVKWEVQTGIPKMVYSTVNLGLTNIVVGDDYFVSTHPNGMFYKWDIEKKKLSKKVNFFEKLKDLNVGSYAAISNDAEWVAIAGIEIGMVLIMNRNLSLKQYFFTPDLTSIVDLAFSPSGNRLVVSIKEPRKNRAVVYEKQGKTWNEIAAYKDHDALVMDVDFLDEDNVVSAGGFHDEIAVWKISSKGTKTRFVASGVGETYFSASLNGTSLAYGLKANKAYGFASYSLVFDLFARQVEELGDSTRFNFPIHKLNGLSLFEQEQVRKTDWDPSEILFLTKEKEKIAKILRYPWNGNQHRSYSFVEPGYIVSGGDYGILTAHNYSGQVVSKFVGHEGSVSSINTSVDDKFIVTAAYDNTMRLWRRNEIGLKNEKEITTSLWNYLKNQFLEDPWHSRILQLSLEKKAKEISFEAWNEVIEKLEKAGHSCDFLREQYDWEKANTIYPVVSIFVGRNKEWVVWNNDGYFTSSKKGAKYIGYHVNQGKKKEAKYYPFDQFDIKYNRPDIIMRDLGFADSGTIELYERAYQKRLKKMGIAEEDLSTDIHAPAVTILKHKQAGSSATIDFKASDEKYTLNRINVFINDVPIYGRKGLAIKNENAKEHSQSLTLDLLNGENKIQISVLNNKGVESLRETIYLTNTSEVKSDLYLISLGVSNYKDTKFNLNYAAKDAEDIVTAFEDNQVYETVHQKTMLNERVTRENILELKEFLAAAKTNDVVMLFIAGHGVLDKNLDYYYCTYDVDFLQPQLRGVSYAELEALFDGIKAIRKLLIMDTCHSGELDKDDVEEIAIENTTTSDITFRSGAATNAVRERVGLKKTNEAVKEMFNDLNRGTGATIISSAGGVEYAMESAEWKNGLFTYCLLHGIKSKLADLNNDGRIFISELQEFVRLTVVKISKGKQQPSSRYENISLDYAIW